MKKVLRISIKTILLAAWLYGVFTLYALMMAYPMSLTDICTSSAPDEKYCLALQNSYFYYYSLYALILALYGGLVAFTGNLIRWSIILFVTAISFFTAHKLAMSDIADLRTYGYQDFLIILHSWTALIASLLFAAFLFRKKWKIFALIAAISTVIFTYIAANKGGGSSDHLAALIGPTYLEFTWENLQKGYVFIYIRSFALMAVIFAVFTGIFKWISRGDIKKEDNVLGYLKISATFISILLISLISIPFGISKYEKQVEETKTFINEITAKLENYKKETEGYPHSIFEVVKLDIKTPKLLDIFEYKANENKGSYYFSRDDKYCFIFMDGGINFGFHSLTSQRGWEYSKYEGVSLENSYIKLCDEDGAQSHEGLVASHLGLIDPNDPVAAMGNDIGEFNRVAETASASKKLEDVLIDLGRKDPSIYGDKSQEFTIEEYMELMKKTTSNLFDAVNKARERALNPDINNNNEDKAIDEN